MPAHQLNPFKSTSEEAKHSAMVETESQRAIAEIQAEITIAKRFPRDQQHCMDKILQAFSRPSLAEESIYAYPKGGQVLSDLSIRAAEAIATGWNNIKFGVRELEQSAGSSVVQSYARDLENNVFSEKTFTVKHIRHRKSGPVVLTDPRDIYEMCANQGARRLRACILAIIPTDVKEAVKRQVEITLKNSVEATPEQLENLVSAFSKLGVTREMLVKRLGHSLDATISAEIISLKKVYASLRDGMSSIKDWFDTDQSSDRASALSEKIEASKKVKAAKQEQKANDDPNGPIPGLD